MKEKLSRFIDMKFRNGNGEQILAQNPSKIKTEFK